MPNCNHEHGHCHKHGEHCGCKHGESGNENCTHHGKHNEECCGNNGAKKGNRRRLFEEKYAQYLMNNEMPKFETDQEFEEWLTSDCGKKYSDDIANIWKEVEIAHPWGGKREFAGRRKTCAKKIPFNRRINEDVLNILKQYSEKHQITETEALEKAIMMLEEA